jgi:hypothetical protein
MIVNKMEKSFMYSIYYALFYIQMHFHNSFINEI